MLDHYLRCHQPAFILPIIVMSYTWCAYGRTVNDLFNNFFLVYPSFNLIIFQRIVSFVSTPKLARSHVKHCIELFELFISFYFVHVYTFGIFLGPAIWPQLFPDAGGVRQSPVNIDTSQTTQDESLKSEPLRWNYVSDNCLSITNTGYGWRLDVDGNGSGETAHTYTSS